MHYCYYSSISASTSSILFNLKWMIQVSFVPGSFMIGNFDKEDSYFMKVYCNYCILIKETNLQPLYWQFALEIIGHLKEQGLSQWPLSYFNSHLDYQFITADFLLQVIEHWIILNLDLEFKHSKSVDTLSLLITKVKISASFEYTSY